MAISKEEFQAKIKRLEAARIKAEQFVAAGGDLKSKEAVPIGLELIYASNEVSTEFGHPFLQDIKCVCGHIFSSHNSSTEAQVDPALLKQPPPLGNIYTDEPRGKTRCNVSGCNCLTWRPETGRS